MIMNGKKENSLVLMRARAYEAESAKKSGEIGKPAFHLTPPIGWMNDPNGFSLFQEEYHLFFQYHPYSTHWGPMHWGHSTTKDFIKWRQLPCAIAPDMEYDDQGCFSGSAIESDGKHILMYTGVSKESQTQCIAVGDGVNYHKSACNPVITGEMLPEGSSQIDFRDPRIWKEDDIFYSVVGSKKADGRGQLALFSSLDAQDWKFESIMDSGSEEYGEMWECPDFFPLDGEDVLIVSPQFMRAKGMEFHNGNNSVVFVGTYDKQNKILNRKQAVTIDYGLDFYAPQTVLTEDGRRIMIAWAHNWDNYMTPDQANWSGMMTIPRQLSIKEGKLIQTPVAELSHYRKQPVSYSNVEVGDKPIQLDGIEGRILDMEMEVNLSEADSLTIKVAADENHSTILNIDAVRQIFTTDRTYSGVYKDMVCSRSMAVPMTDKKVKMRVIMDKYIIEVFINDGEKVMTTTIYTPMDAAAITFEAEGKAVISIEKYDIVI